MKKLFEGLRTTMGANVRLPLPPHTMEVSLIVEVDVECGLLVEVNLVDFECLKLVLSGLGLVGA